MTKIKICGITNENDALFCAECGADFLGFIFVPGSPRFVEPEKAGAIAARIRESDKSSKFVGVFRDASADYIREIKSVAGFDLVQLHGSETDDDIRELGIPAIKALHVAGALPDTHATPTAAWLLFGTYDEQRAGRTGRRFYWALRAKFRQTEPL